jgi:hypothetical protein
MTRSSISAVVVSSMCIEGNGGDLIYEAEVHHLGRLQRWLSIQPNFEAESPKEAWCKIRDVLKESRQTIEAMDYVVVCIGAGDVPIVKTFASLPAEKMVYIYDHGALKAGLFQELERIGHYRARRFNAISLGGLVRAPKLIIDYFQHTGKVFPRSPAEVVDHEPVLTMWTDLWPPGELYTHG